MLDWLLTPFTTAVSFVLSGAHHLLSALGLPATGGLTWALSICLLVLIVKLALLPLVRRQVRLSHAGAHAQPDLAAIRRRYAGRTDRESLLKQAAELRDAQREHGIGAAAALPMLVQLPVMSGLYFVLRDVAAGSPIGAITASLAQSAAHARIGGIALNATLTGLGVSPAGVGFACVVGVLALLTYLTQRHLVLPNQPAHALEGQAGQVQRLMPGLSAVGVLVGAVVMPAGVLLYWVVSAVWTLAQQSVVTRFWPTPTSAAALRRA